MKIEDYKLVQVTHCSCTGCAFISDDSKCWDIRKIQDCNDSGIYVLKTDVEPIEKIRDFINNTRTVIEANGFGEYSYEEGFLNSLQIVKAILDKEEVVDHGERYASFTLSSELKYYNERATKIKKDSEVVEEIYSIEQEIKETRKDFNSKMKELRNSLKEKQDGRD